MYSDDEATSFEQNPFGARQRLLPSRVFRQNNPVAEEPPPPVMATPLPRPRPCLAPLPPPPPLPEPMIPVPVTLSMVVEAITLPVAMPMPMPMCVAVALPYPARPIAPKRDTLPWGLAGWFLGSIAAFVAVCALLASVENPAIEARSTLDLPGVEAREAIHIKLPQLTASEDTPPAAPVEEVAETRPHRAHTSYKRRHAIVDTSTALGSLRMPKSR